MRPITHSNEYLRGKLFRQKDILHDTLQNEYVMERKRWRHEAFFFLSFLLKSSLVGAGYKDGVLTPKNQ